MTDETVQKSGIGELETQKMREPFFRKIDWTSFWTATVISFIVYFLTLGPSVGLEDSGELAVAGDHLGVPHPPGYPIWTMISYLLARVFSFVTFRGQPNPAWAIALGSAICGAFAAGCTAMLITRSASDMLADAQAVFKRRSMEMDHLLCWVGGVAGSLIFAFSPVMWSQSTIVEVYSLGAFFLMLVMLLTYRWMRQPSDKVLWWTAFVFGLGLTNYQVLLLAALPLFVIIFLRNIALFRDFLLVIIPLGLAAVILKLGALDQQQDLPKYLPHMAKYVIEKDQALLRYEQVNIPAGWMITVGVVLFCLSVVAMFVAKRRKEERFPISLGAIGAAVLGFLFLLLAPCFSKAMLAAENNPDVVYLTHPYFYCFMGAGAVALFGCVFYAVFLGEDRESFHFKIPVRVAGVIFLVMLIVAVSLAAPKLTEQLPPVAALEEYANSFPIVGIWKYNVAFVFGIVVFIALAYGIKGGFLFALPVAAIEIIAYILVLKGVFLGLTHPTTWWFWTPLLFNFIILVLAGVTLPSGRSVAYTILMGELGVSFYAYMPIVSDLRNPPMNWGYPRTWEGFKHAITRGQYEKITPTNIFTPRFISQIGDYFTDLRRQFTLLLAPFGFLPFAAWRFHLGKTEGEQEKASKKLVGISAGLAVLAVLCWGLDFFLAADAISDAAGKVLRMASVLALLASIGTALVGGMRPLSIAICLIVFTLLFVVLGNIPAIERVFDLSRIDKLTLGGLLLITVLGGLWIVFLQMKDAVERILQGHDKNEVITGGLVISGCSLFGVGLLHKILQAVFVYGYAFGKTGGVAEIIEANWGIFFANAVAESRLLFVFFPGILAMGILAVIVWGLVRLSKKSVVSSGFDNISQQWIIGTVCNFLVMSILLIMLANPKGDLQDTFIQKVKFISSHGLFALWIGYGLVFAMLVFNGLFEKIAKTGRAVRVLTVLFAVLVFCSSAIPIHQNYFNDRLVFELSGAEQNGHDYGWQFGNYQLRGAEAITEELDADEEPLPNPSYPPPMGKGAIFFGGTDPGRFVPTYMIYSADVRPDVFLITQNALADGTFMSVTRDLYGDQIWIPTPYDNSRAFTIYTDEVKQGKRTPNSEISMEGGRVQVVGALGVMEINGILCKMIFDHNKPGAYNLKSENGRSGHEFYVEESYVIPWMYPYLVPHGLIMHLQSEPKGTIPRQRIHDDMDFWDWYVRRITRDGRYRRDIVAQKSFSKLRSAIAGLYINQYRMQEAERAYNDARVLYPVSPEATLRHIQDILFRFGRFEEALESINYFCEKDPNNDRGPMMRNYIEKILEDTEERKRIYASYPEGEKLPIEAALRVAEIDLGVGNQGSAAEILRAYVSDSGLSVGQVFKMANYLVEANDALNAARAMNRVEKSKLVRDNPNYLKVGIRIYAMTGDAAKLEGLLERYLQLMPEDWQMWIDKAAIEVSLGNNNKAIDSLQKAYTYGREMAMREIENNPALVSFLKALESISQAIDQSGKEKDKPFADPYFGPRRF